jgi:hypothetical protein
LHRFWLAFIVMLLWSGRSSAQIVVLTIASDPSGVTLGGILPTAVTLSFGTAQAFGGTVATGVTKTVGASNWTLSTPIDVTVTQVGISTSYHMTAQLTAADATNTWSLNSIAFSTTTATITNSHAYGTAPYSLSLTIPFSAAAGSISNTVNITVTAN